MQYYPLKNNYNPEALNQSLFGAFQVEGVYHDPHVLLAEKPAGLSTQPYFEEELKRRFNVRFLHAVHRLDRPVSGLVLFARSSKALARLHDQMRQGRIERTYCAEVEGLLALEEGELEHFLVHGDRCAKLATNHHPQAKRARLSFRVTGRHKETTRLSIRLETGRYHQIRVQCAAIGHPIVGDKLYGGAFRERLHLHCETLSFLHPISKERLSISRNAPF
jgi:23S rRNA pseudouridine1911/1915/1917 synthase